MNGNGNYKWTVLIYAAADEDLKPYILRQLNIIKEQVIAENVQVVIQVSLPTNKQASSDGNRFAGSFEPSGRYIIENKSALLLEELDNPDMTDPRSLLDFLLWGSRRFPSERLMLIMSGHSMGFIGLLANSMDENISLMSIPGFARALSYYKQYSPKNIDLLVLDTCFMDTVEIAAELALTVEQAVDNVILADGNPSLAGMPCDLIINRLMEDQVAITRDQWLAETIYLVNEAGNESHFIFAINLIQDYYLELKALIDRLAECLLHDPNRFLKTLKDNNKYLCHHFPQLDYLMEILESSYPELIKYAQRIRELQQRMLITPANYVYEKRQNPCLRIFLPANSSVYLKYSDFYARLAFVNMNRWLQVLYKIHSQ